MGVYHIKLQELNKARRKEEYWCNRCGRRLGRRKQPPNNVCWFCKRKEYITNPLISLNGKPYVTNEHGERI